MNRNPVFKAWAPAFAGVTILASVGVAANGPGTTGSPFLKIPINGRAAALGGAFGAVSGDAAVLDYNPAGLSGIQRTDLQATYIDHFEDTSLQSLTIGFPMMLRTAPFADSPDVFDRNRMAFGLEYRVFRAQDTARDPVTGRDLGDFDVRDQLIELGMAYPVASFLSLGITGKSISNKVQDKSVSTFAVDTGVMAKVPGGLTLGLAMQNMGSGKALDEEKDDLPTIMRGSLSYRYQSLLLLADLANSKDGVNRQSAGLEWAINHYVRLRAGTFNTTDIEFTGGLGVQFTGPQKNAAPAYRPPTANTQPGKQAKITPSTMSQQIMQRSVQKLTDQFLSAEPDMRRPTLAVLPLNSLDNVAPTITDMVIKNFGRQPDFSMVDPSAIRRIYEEQKMKQAGAPDPEHAAEIGSLMGTDLVLVGSVDKTDEKYAIIMKLVKSEDATVIANSYSEIAIEDFNSRQTLGSSRDTTPRASNRPEFNRVDLGIDYGLATNNDIGITHTVTLKILY